MHHNCILLVKEPYPWQIILYFVKTKLFVVFAQLYRRLENTWKIVLWLPMWLCFLAAYYRRMKLVLKGSSAFDI